MKFYSLKYITVLIIIFMNCLPLLSQVDFNGRILNEENEPLPNATIRMSSLGRDKNYIAPSDAQGNFSFKSIERGRYSIKITFIGYKTFEDSISVPLENNQALTIKMVPENVTEEETVISASRINRTITDVPVRVELIPSEEIEEAITMLLSSSKMLLGELPGVMAQTISSNLGASTIRLRGLPGKYTQILLDGVPAFGGLNLNTSVLQIPPLNLKQLEIIKGTAGIQSDAIAGIINFITRSPVSDKLEGTMIANITNKRGADFAEWIGKKYDNLGISLHTTYNYQDRIDVDGDGYIDIPYQSKLVINPRLDYLFGNNARLLLSGGYTNFRRFGGLMDAALDFNKVDTSHYFSSLKSDRIDLYGSLILPFNKWNSIILNAAYSRTNRFSNTWLIPFNGLENLFYSDLQWSGNFGDFSVLSGVVAFNQSFIESSSDSVIGGRNFDYTELSLFTQAELHFTETMTALGFVRVDEHNKYGVIAVPRFTLMYKPAKSLTFRGSIGTGWRAATIFDETSEDLGYFRVPVINLNQPEKSFSANINSNYKFQFLEDIAISLDLNLFYSNINHVIELDTSKSIPFRTYNWIYAGNLRNAGLETILQAQYRQWEFNIGYTFNNVRELQNGQENEIYFTPVHFINTNLIYKISNKIRLLAESMFLSPQLLPPNNEGLKYSPNVFTFGVSGEYWFTEKLSAFINFENLFDYRQTRYTKAYTGVPGSPYFNPGFVWGSLEGRTINGGLKFTI